MTEHIGWIGTGIMGEPMCGHLLDAGCTAHVYTRTASKAARLVARGAILEPSPRRVAEASERVFTMVGFPADVEQVVTGADGVLAGAHAGMIFVDMTTSEPALAQRLYAAAAERGVQALDAPVSGGDIGARDASLSIMVGGDAAAFQIVLPLFQRMGRTITHMGPAGAGQHTKMCNQIAAAATLFGVVESLLYANRAGLDPAHVLDVVGSGAAASWALNHLGRRIVQGDFAPGFFIKHFVKDLGIALSEARRMRLELPALALADRFYRLALAQGLEHRGTQALYLVLESLRAETTSC